MTFIHKHEIPKDRVKDITFGKIVVEIHPQKAEPEHRRLTIVVTDIDYPWEVATPTLDLITAKLFFNFVVSTPHQLLGSIFSIWHLTGAGCLAMNSASQKGGVERHSLLLSRYIVKQSQFTPHRCWPYQRSHATQTSKSTDMHFQWLKS